MKNKVFLFFCLVALLGCSNNKPKDNAEKIKELTGKEYLKKYGDTLSLEEAIEIAKERNLDLRIKSLEREIAHLDRNIAFGNFLPSINLMGGYTRLDNPIDINVDTSSISNILTGFGLNMSSSMSSRVVDKSFYTYGITAQVPIFVPSTWYLYAARKKGEEVHELIENLAKKMITLQIMGEYYYILALQSENKTLINEVNSAKELEKKIKVSLKVEAVLPWQYDKAVVFRKSKEYALNENKKDLLIAKMNFLKSLNLNPLTDIQLEKINETEDLKVLSMEDCVYEALSGNETLQITKISKNINKDIKKIAITNFLPKIILSGGYMNNSNDIFADPSFLYGNVSGVLSIFNGFRNINEYKKAVRKEKIGELKLEKEFMTTMVETIKAYKNYQNAKELKNISALNYKAAMGELHQKTAEKRVEMIGEEEYYQALANFDNALTMKNKADFNYEMAKGSLKIAMGRDPFKEER